MKNRKQSLLNKKRISNLYTFDFGTSPSSGYQSTGSPHGLGESVLFQAPSLDGTVQQARHETVQGAIKGVSNIGVAAIPGLLTGAVALGKSLGTSAGSSIASAAGSSAATLAGSVLGAVGSLKGAIDYGTGIAQQQKAYMTDDHMRQYNSVIQAQGIGGQTYAVNTGYDKAGVGRVNKQMVRGARLKTALGGTATGAGVGSMILPGVGTAIGAGIGALIGGLSTLFGARKRRRKIAAEQAALDNALSSENRQNESVADSIGMRNLYAEQYTDVADSGLYHADDGMSEATARKAKRSGKIQKVWTPDGIQYGPVNSLVGAGETLADLGKGVATYVDKGRRRVDNQPAIASNDPAEQAATGYNTIVFGNGTDPYTGKKFSDEVAPYAIKLEELNNIKLSNDPNTRAVQEREINKLKEPILKEMNDIANRQRIYHTYKQQSVDVDKFDLGSIALNLIPTAINTLGNLSMYNRYKNDKPVAYNAYVPNNNTSAAYNLMNYRPNINPQIQAAGSAQRHAQYNINNSAYSPGQRMAMLRQLYNDNMRSKQAIYAAAEEQYANNRRALGQAMLEAGERESAARTATNAQQYEWYRQARAARQRGMDSHYVGMLDSITKGFQNFNNEHWANKYLKRYSSNGAPLMNSKSKPNVDIDNIMRDRITGYTAAAKQDILNNYNPLSFVFPHHKFLK